ncbi:MAG: Fic family protein [Pseudomonadaceae bacterium]|nr:Fic family protein [Pseudomonadaceae bacterium]
MITLSAEYVPHARWIPEVEERNDRMRKMFLDQNILIACSFNPAVNLTTVPFIRTLNYLTLLNLKEQAGMVRDVDVSIRGYNRELPSWWTVKDQLLDMVQTAGKNWNIWQPDEMAAYLMWRLVWIHPFEDGNDRTSRDLGYAGLCCKFGRFLPGSRTVVDYLQHHRAAYFSALRHADQTHDQGQTDIWPLRNMIRQGLREQLDTTLHI